MHADAGRCSQELRGPGPPLPWGRRCRPAWDPAPVPGGVQRPQRFPSKVVGAEEQHPPGRLLADLGASAALHAEPGR